MSRSSSPFSSASSPYPASSSPPSSPTPATESDIDEWHSAHSSRMHNPLAASANADLPPRRWPKRRRLSNMATSSSFDSGFANNTDSNTDEVGMWDTLIAGPSDQANGVIDGSEKGFTMIPDFVRDLKNFFTVSSGPSRLPIPSRSLGGGRASFQKVNSTFGMDSSKLSLLLSANAIALLPKALFELDNLVVLDIRRNAVRYIPPEVSRLQRLESLNVADNQIEWFPAELLDLKSLTRLLVFPNPLLPLPPSSLSRTLSRVTSESKLPSPRAVGHVVSAPGVPNPSRTPTLVELCLRSMRFEGSDCLLSQPEKELRESEVIPDKFRTLFDTLVPGFAGTSSYSRPKSSNLNSMDEIYGLSLCPSPLHEVQVSFLLHQTERFTWEHSVNGHTVGTNIPVRWRGCSRGCLDFLEPAQQLEAKDVLQTPAGDSDDEDVGQVLDLGRAGAGFEEFD